MTRFSLETREPCGNTDPRNRQHYVDGRRVVQDAYLYIYQTALATGRLENLTSARKGGNLHCYAEAINPE